jgi:hypothetical protein
MTTNVSHITLKGPKHVFSDASVAANEARMKAGVEPQHVMRDKDLPIALRAGTDSDHWNF